MGTRYAVARIAAQRVQPRFAGMDAHTIEQLIDRAFWASLRREEGWSPKISLAFLSPEQAGAAMTFERPLELTPEALAHLAPAAERPGIHLGVWPDSDTLRVWGATRAIPAFCFVLEVIAPGLLVLKHRHGDASSKFVNVAVLEGDQIKVLNTGVSDIPGFGDTDPNESVNVLVELAVSMRAHGRGGALLVVPSESEEWRESIRHPIHYSVAPRFSRLRELMQDERAARAEQRWQESLHRTIEAVAGLTAVDGATVITRCGEVLAFGVKIRRREGCPSVEQVLLTEPAEGAEPQILPALQTGGTRHISAAQFAHDQRDAMALVASQDGRFTVFIWSGRDAMIRAHRMEALLL